MKKISRIGWFCFPLLFLILTSVHGQRVNFDRIVPPNDIIAKNFEDFLVQIAWQNNPSNDVLQNRVNIADLEKKQAKVSWLNGVGLSSNFNRGDSSYVMFGGNTYLVGSGLNVGVSVRLYPIFTTGSNIKIAKENIKIAEHELNQEKLKLRAEVLQRYRGYLASIEILKARTKAEEDASANYELLSKLFELGEVDFEDYNDASIAYHRSVEGRIQATTDIELSKIRLEEIIGIPWEETLRFVPRQ